MVIKDTIKKLYKFYSIPYKLWGQDFDGCDCYGFIVLVYKELFSIEIEQPTPSKIGKGTERRSNSIKPFFSPFKEVFSPQFMDVVLFLNENGLPLHVGIYLEKEQVLNMSSEEGVHVIKLNDSRILSKNRYDKFAGFFRHEAFFQYPLLP